MAQPQGSGTLVFLEDSAAVTQRAQVIKLASLGRLAASIAHEVRNPLGAISHAGQLLAESPGLAEGDRRLTRIIGEQCQRVNAIVQSVMEIGRRRAPAPTTLRLGPWLGQFLDELARDSGIEQADLVLEVEGDGPEVRMDPMQLHQVLHNLCENGRRHARGHPALRLRVGIQRETDRPYLDVCDSGPGVPEDSVQHLFEPFFTTDRGGTGLGLYIARELCEVNQASLNHLGAGEAGHCFRITFAHPLRRGYLRHE
jgi:two-component system sensor histidine kinase PilS (NtrC family)